MNSDMTSDNQPTELSIGAPTMPAEAGQVKSRIQALGLSQAAIERRLRYSAGYLSRLLSGEMRSTRAWKRIFAFLDRAEARAHRSR